MENLITLESICKRWDGAERPLFKGKLIDDKGCCCAQGDVLRVYGYTDEELREMTQAKADWEVAKILNISTTHSILLRHINDKKDGCPQDVLRNPSKILGPEADSILKLWTWAGQQKDVDHADVADAAYAADAADAAYAAYVAAGADAADAAYAADAADAAYAAYVAAGADRFYRRIRGATLEIIAHKKLNKFYFLPKLGFNSLEDIKALPDWRK